MTAEDERTVHRVEAFSDIVIGFSLAQLGVSLSRVTGHGITAIDPVGVFSFLFAFAIICSLWFFHHRLFAVLFVPKTVPMLLNFAWLAVVVMLVVVAQTIAVKWTNPAMDMTYFGLYALAYAILAAQAAIGLRGPRAVTPLERLSGLRQLVFMSWWAIVFALCFLLTVLLPPMTLAGNLISATFTVGGICSVVIARFMRARAQALGFTPARGANLQVPPPSTS